MIKIRINDKSGNNIAECDLYKHDIGIWYVQHKSNVINIYSDIKQNNKNFESYDEIIDIDIDIKR